RKLPADVAHLPENPGPADRNVFYPRTGQAPAGASRPVQRRAAAASRPDRARAARSAWPQGRERGLSLERGRSGRLRRRLRARGLEQDAAYAGRAVRGLRETAALSG